MRHLCLATLLFISVSLCAQNSTENIVIVTLDGMRWQEVFGGADSMLLQNKKYTHDSAGTSSAFWAADSNERRRKLFPFLWNIIAQHGQLYVNRWFDNKVNNANSYFFFLPGIQ